MGVELDTPDGKNDGIVKGTLYFKCSPNHGSIFLSPILFHSVLFQPSSTSIGSHHDECPVQFEVKNSLKIDDLGLSFLRKFEFHIDCLFVLLLIMDGLQCFGYC